MIAESFLQTWRSSGNGSCRFSSPTELFCVGLCIWKQSNLDQTHSFTHKEWLVAAKYLSAWLTSINSYVWMILFPVLYKTWLGTRISWELHAIIRNYQGDGTSLIMPPRTSLFCGYLPIPHTLGIHNTYQGMLTVPSCGIKRQYHSHELILGIVKLLIHALPFSLLVSNALKERTLQT